MLVTYVEKTSYFEVTPGHTIAYKDVDDLFKKNVSI